MFTKWLTYFALVGLTLGGLLGCSESAQRASRTASSLSKEYAQEKDSGGAAAESAAVAPSAALADGSAEGSEDGSPAATQDRKIIYDTSIDLVVDNYQDFEKRITQLVNQHGGFVSHAETRRRYSDRQSGTWTVRVPVDQYSEFLTGVTSLGFAESRKENAQDVTEEFVDIEARIENKRKLEQRIITLLDERTGKLADVLEIERELSRVREEIEVMEGRLRYLSDRTSLATITINCREEEEKYTPAEAPTFASRIGRSWRRSLGALSTTGENLVVALVACIPWLVVFGIPVALVAAVFWRSRRKGK